MDAIGQLNLQLGDLEAQKFQGRSQALGAISGGVKNIVTDYQKQQVENALAGDFNSIAKAAKEKGIPDTLLNTMAGMWNAAQGRDEKLKIIANLQSVIQAKEEKDKLVKSVEGYKSLPQGYSAADVAQKYEPGSEDAAKLFMAGASEPVKTKPRSPEDKATVLFGSFAQGKDLVPKAGRSGNQEESRQELINKYSDEFARQLMASGDPDFANKTDALGYARAVLKNEIKAQVADRPTNINIHNDKIDNNIQKDIIRLKKSSKDLSELMKSYDPSFASIGPLKSIADISNTVDSRFSNNPKAASWWKNLNRYFTAERKDLFGSSFTEGEQKLWNQIALNPANSNAYINEFLNSLYDKIESDQEVNAEVATSKTIADKVKATAIAPRPVIGGSKVTPPTAPASSTGQNKKKTIKVGNTVLEY